LPVGSPIVAVICGNLKPPIGMPRICRRAPLVRRLFDAACPIALIRTTFEQVLRHRERDWKRITFDLGGERAMFDFQDLFQWDRFITPTIIKTFYLLVIALIVLFGISGIFSGLAMMAVSPFGGFIVVLSSIASVIVGVIFARIAAEFVLIVFRINEHLGVIRDQGPRH
jgi:predicted membrane metal-binding protein